MTYIPVNKTTGIKYPSVDEAGKLAYENDPMTKGKYRFEVVKEEAPKTAKKPVEPGPVVEPIESKRVKDISQTDE